MGKLTTPPPPRSLVPSLTHGERLDQKTFHTRYEAMPEHVKAELIEGVVYMASPASLNHGSVDGHATTWLGNYMLATQGVFFASNATVILGEASEPQPDVCLGVLPDYGGQSRVTIINGKDYVEGPPELVAEVSFSTEAIDTGPKLRDYERAGVLEYLILLVGQQRVVWHVRSTRKKHFAELKADADGIYRSPCFPGLWLDAPALLKQNRKWLEVLQQGLASPEHAKFAAALARRKK